MTNHLHSEDNCAAISGCVDLPEGFRVLLVFRWVAAAAFVIRFLPAEWRLVGHFGKIDIDRVSKDHFYYDVCLKISEFFFFCFD